MPLRHAGRGGDRLRLENSGEANEEIRALYRAQPLRHPAPEPLRPILVQRQQEEAQRAYEAERHLVVFSDLPQDVNDGLAQRFYEQKHLRVQIYSKSDSEIRQSLKDDGGVKPDILIASEDDLQAQKKNGILQPTPHRSRISAAVHEGPGTALEWPLV